MIVSIHDSHPRGFLSFDLLQILEAITAQVRQYSWIVTDAEVVTHAGCTGELLPIGRVLSFAELVHHARHVRQTIEGEVLGWPAASLIAPNLELISRILEFPRSQARVAIRAVDSCFFEVITKDPPIIDLIRQRFRDVRVQDPRNYF
jgi:hypothetical protein